MQDKHITGAMMERKDFREWLVQKSAVSKRFLCTMMVSWAIACGAFSWLFLCVWSAMNVCFGALLCRSTHVQMEFPCVTMMHCTVFWLVCLCSFLFQKRSGDGSGFNPTLVVVCNVLRAIATPSKVGNQNSSSLLVCFETNAQHWCANLHVPNFTIHFFQFVILAATSNGW